MTRKAREGNVEKSLKICMPCMFSCLFPIVQRQKSTQGIIQLFSLLSTVNYLGLMLFVLLISTLFRE